MLKCKFKEIILHFLKNIAQITNSVHFIKNGNFFAMLAIENSSIEPYSVQIFKVKTFRQTVIWLNTFSDRKTFTSPDN